MEESMNIILIGAQGSGKGTQAEKLSEALGICHVASGDLFRKALSEQTALGLKAKTYMDKGELVPDDITVAMILERLTELRNTPGILLDGFPRTIAQAQVLDQELERVGQRIHQAIYLEVPRETLLRRLSGRYICRAHQHIYNIHSLPPKVSGICDLDGSPLYQRADDTGEAVQKRLDIFFNETIHLLDCYRRQHKLTVVNGNQDIEQVHRQLLGIISVPVGMKGINELRPWQIPHTPIIPPAQ
jgi:adenylate kinase